jgi:hypothetical protein
MSEVSQDKHLSRPQVKYVCIYTYWWRVSLSDLKLQQQTSLAAQRGYNEVIHIRAK